MIPIENPDLAVVVTAILASIAYGTLGYLVHFTDEGEPVDPLTYTATLLVALAIGLGSIQTGNPLGQDEFMIELVAYTGTIVLLQKFLETIIPLKYKRALKQWAAAVHTADRNGV